MNVGIAGEFRLVVSKLDGTEVFDTGYQKNMILNQGLEFFGGTKGYTINGYCAVGSGNSVPFAEQTALDNIIGITSGSISSSSYSYVDKGDNLYKLWEENKYRFTDLGNVNISEVGLASQSSSKSSYYLTTRALIKDSLGLPTTISVKSDETLDIYYKIHKIIDLSDKSYVVNMLDGNGGSVAYNATVRPFNVGKSKWGTKISAHAADSNWLYFSSVASLSAVTEAPSASSINASLSSTAGYVGGSYKLIVNNTFRLGDAINGVRLLTSGDFSFYCYQIYYSAVDGGGIIPKTSNDTLSLPVELSWGRYEGEI